MKICVGIISYLPDDHFVRVSRFNKLQDLIQKVNEIFNVDILIVAQNWQDDHLMITNLEQQICIFSYKNRLGINGARKKLRKHFLESEYDYMIMLDDDSELIGSKAQGEAYLEQIRNHPNKWAAYKPMLLKLFAISKWVFNQIDYYEGSVENGDFFEDMLLIKMLEKKFPYDKFIFHNTGLIERSDSARDPLSTWYHGQFVKKEIGDRTRSIAAKC